MNRRSGSEYDKDGNLLQKELLVKLMLNRSIEKLQPNPTTAPLSAPIIIKGFESKGEQSQLDLDEHLMLCVSQPYRLDRATRDRFITHHHLLHINDDNRKQFILLFSGAYYCMLTNANYYELVLEQIGTYPPHFFSSIEKDILRTFSDNNQLQPSLRNVLCAYAIRNPRLLYCQGLNYLVAYFLMRDYTEQESFWLLAQLVEEVLPVDYYVEMGAVVSLSNILSDLLSQTIKGFMEYCQEISLQTSFFLVPWLICLYTKGFSSSLSNFIMECLVIEKQVALVKTSLTLLMIVAPKLQHCEDFGVFMKDLEMMVPSISLRQFKGYYDSIYINRYFFRVLLDSYLKQYWKRAEGQSIEAALKTRNTLPKCSLSLPVCLHVIEINRKFRNITQVDTLKVGPKLDEYFDEGYFNHSQFNGNPVPNCKNSYFKKSIDQLLIGRHEHICQKQHQPRKSIELASVQEKIDLEKMVRDIIEEPEQEVSVSVELEDFTEKSMRRTNQQRIGTISSIFEIVQDFETESFDAIEVAVQQKKESSISKRESLIRIPEKAPPRHWWEKLF